MSRNAIATRHGVSSSPRANLAITFTSIDPPTASDTTEVVLTGTGFASDLTGTVGGTGFSGLTVTSATTAAATTPSKSVGTYDVVLRRGGHRPSTLTQRMVYTGGGASSYSDPDIVVNASFEANFDGFCTPSFTTVTGATRDTTHAYAGSYAVYRTLPVTNGAGDVAANLWFPFYASNQKQFNPSPASPASTYSKLWARTYFYLNTAIDGILKFFPRYQASGFGTHIGGLYFNSGYLAWVFGPEGNSVAHPLTTLSSLVDQWNEVEVAYDRCNLTYPEVQIRLNGSWLTQGVGSPPSPWSWSGTILSAGTRLNSSRLGVIGLMPTLNGLSAPFNTIAGELWMDRVALSSVGTIGP